MFTLMMLIIYTILFVPLIVMIWPAIVSPCQWWWRTQSQKYQHPEATEPSALAYHRIQRSSVFGLGVLCSCFLLLIYLAIQEHKMQERKMQQLLKMQQFDRDMQDPQKRQQILRNLKQTGKPPANLQ